MQWWNSLSETERADALTRAGDGSHIPSAADAWAFHKRRLAAAALLVVKDADSSLRTLPHPARVVDDQAQMRARP
jgi:hypothetical protein